MRDFELELVSMSTTKEHHFIYCCYFLKDLSRSLKEKEEKMLTMHREFENVTKEKVKFHFIKLQLVMYCKPLYCPFSWSYRKQ